MTENNYVKQQISRTQTQASFPYLIEISHEDLGIFRYVNMDRVLTWEGNEDQPACFSIQPPQYSSKGISSAQLTITAIDQEWIIRIRETSKRASIRFIAAFVDTKEDGLQIEPLEDMYFTLTKANWTEISITWEMETKTVLQTQVPIQTADACSCPGVA